MKRIKVAPLAVALLLAGCAVDEAERNPDRAGGPQEGGGGSKSEAGAGSSGSGGSAGASGTGGTAGEGAGGGLDASAGGSAGSGATGGSSGSGATGGASGAAGAGGSSGASGTGGASGASGASGGGASGAAGSGGSSGSAVDGSAGSGGTTTPTIDAALDRQPDITPDAAIPPEAAACTGAGNALHFNGAANNFARLTRPVADDLTIEAWIKTTSSLDGTRFYEGLGLIYADASGQSNDFAVAITQKKLAWGIGNPDFTLLSRAEVTTGEWLHFAITRERSSGRSVIYINGVLDSQTSTGNTSSLNASPQITIGANTINGHYYNGDLDEVRIWNTVRSQAAIQATMAKRLAGNEVGLVAYFRFDQPNVTVINDEQTWSSNKYNAQVTGTVTWVPSGVPICP